MDFFSNSFFYPTIVLSMNTGFEYIDRNAYQNCFRFLFSVRNNGNDYLYVPWSLENFA